MGRHECGNPKQSRIGLTTGLPFWSRQHSNRGSSAFGVLGVFVCAVLVSLPQTAPGVPAAEIDPTAEELQQIGDVAGILSWLGSGEPLRTALIRVHVLADLWQSTVREEDPVALPSPLAQSLSLGSLLLSEEIFRQCISRYWQPKAELAQLQTPRSLPELQDLYQHSLTEMVISELSVTPSYPPVGANSVALRDEFARTMTATWCGWSFACVTSACLGRSGSDDVASRVNLCTRCFGMFSAVSSSSFSSES